MQQCNNETIYNTIAFFDFFDYPLTAFEVWKYLPEKVGLSAVGEVLKSGIRGVVFRQGFYCLEGRQSIVDTRQSRYISSCRKFKKARRMARLFSFVPWVRLVALGNSIGANNLKEDGDIDFYILTQSNRIWISRFFCTGLAKLLHLRPRPDKLRDKMCLSFYADERAMDMRPLMLAEPEGEDQDIYFVYWLAGLYPIYDQGGYYEKLIQANQWIFRALPNWQFIVPARMRTSGNAFGPMYRDLWDILLGGLENYAKQIQMAIMPKQLAAAARKGQGVVINDRVLKFHLNDRREQVRERYMQHCINC